MNITKEGVFWDCVDRSACDRRPLGLLGDFSPGFRDNDDRLWKRLLLNTMAFGDLDASIDWYWFWRRAVQDYTQRELSDMGDQTIALNSIAKRFGSRGGEEYILGSKEGPFLIADLVCGTGQRGQTLPQYNMRMQGKSVIAPSWSWVSIPDPVKYRLWHPSERFLERKHEHTQELARCHSTMLVKYDNCAFDMFFGRLTLNSSITKALLFEGSIFMQRNTRLPPQDNTAAEPGRIPAHAFIDSTYLNHQEDDNGAGGSSSSSRYEPSLYCKANRVLETGKNLKNGSITAASSSRYPCRGPSLIGSSRGLSEAPTRRRTQERDPSVGNAQTIPPPRFEIKRSTNGVFPTVITYGPPPISNMEDSTKEIDPEDETAAGEMHRADQPEEETKARGEEDPQPLESFTAGDLKDDQHKSHHEREFAETLSYKTEPKTPFPRISKSKRSP